MKEKVRARNVLVLLIVIVLSLIIIAESAYFTAFGSFINMKSEPMQVFGIGLYPNTNEEGNPISYSAVLYNANLVIGRGNAVAYFNPESKSRCKLNTAYFYEQTENGFTLYNNDSGEYFDIPSNNLRGRAVSNIPYLGAILSFASSIAGIIVFGVFGLVVLILMIIYIVTFAKRFSKKKQTLEKNQEVEIAEEPRTDRRIEAEQLPTDSGAAGEPEKGSEGADESDNKAEISGEGKLSGEPLNVDIKAQGDNVFITAKGSVQKITKLEKAIKALKDKKGFDISVEPVDASPAGTLIRCDKDKLTIIAAIIKTIDA